MAARPLIFAYYPKIPSMRPSYGPFRAAVDYWRDADTLVVLADMGMGEYACKAIRLAGVNVPDDDAEISAEAYEFVTSIAPSGSPVLLHTYKDRWSETFDRWVATVTVPGGRDVSELLLEQGLAQPYP